MTEPSVPLPPEPAGRYVMRVLWITTAVTVAVIAVVTWLLPYAGLAVPLALVVTLAFIRRDSTPRRRSTVAGILLGCGIGLLVTAGLCTEIFNGNLPSPTFTSG